MINITALGSLRPGPRYDPKQSIAVQYCLFDIDNTLVGNNDSGLPTASFIEAAKLAGKRVAIGVSSARPLTKAGHIIDACHMTGYSLLSNGAQIYDGKSGSMVIEYVIPQKAVLTIIRRLQELQINHWVQDDGIDHFWAGKQEPISTQISSGSLGTYERAVDIWQQPGAGERMAVPAYTPQKPFVIVAHDVSEEQKSALLTMGSEYHGDHITALVGHEKKISEGTMVYDVFFVDTRANKKDALQTITRLSGVPAANTMAVGDGPNDTVIVAFAGIGVAMGNAVDATMQAATLIAPSQADDGACAALRTLVLEQP